jgi:nucleoside-diphosphate-sugar epimerase
MTNQIHPGPNGQTALILGITGAIGGAIAGALARRGFAIRAMSRKPKPETLFAFPVEWVAGDAMNRSAVLDAAQGASLIVHGVNPPGYRHWRELAIPMLANTIHAASIAGATILFPANVYVYGPQSGSVVNETSPKLPTSDKGKVRLQMEQMLEEAATMFGVRSISLRAGDFFGPGVTGSWFSQCVVKGGREAKALQNPSSPGVGHSWAYVPDLAEAFGRLVDRREQLDAFTLLHFAGHWDPEDAMCQTAHTIIGRPALRIKRFPWLTVYLGAPFVPFLREVIPMRWLWQHPLRLDNARLTQTIGEEPHTPMREAISSALA